MPEGVKVTWTARGFFKVSLEHGMEAGWHLQSSRKRGSCCVASSPATRVRLWLEKNDDGDDSGPGYMRFIRDVRPPRTSAPVEGENYCLRGKRATQNQRKIG
jgi:hypothetical protein